jgi:glycosyltransferase involved in cell wall biosynthesis
MSEPKIVMDMRWTGPHGIGRFAAEMFARIPGVHALTSKTALFNPLDPLYLSATLLLNGADVFYSPGFNAPFRERIPIVLTVHDLNYIHCADNSSVLRRAYFNAIVWPACRRAFRVLTVSEFSKRQILEWAQLPDETVVNVGTGVDARYCPEGARYTPGFPYLLAFGSVRPHKNIARLIRAFVTSGLGRELRLVIVGQLDRESAILMRRPEYSAKVHLLGHVAESDLPSIYRGALALCMPSLFEGFGLPTIEAMASGIPVLSANATSLPEVTKGAAILVDPASIESIASGLKEVVFNESLRRALIAKGLDRSGKFTWDETAGKVTQILSQAVMCRSG